MLRALRQKLKRKIFSEQGSITVEFALLVPVFFLMIFGVVDFGHAWYMRHIMSNASREGARYGTRYAVDSLGNRKLPSQLSPAIATYVKTTWGLENLLPSDATPTVVPSGQAWTETNTSVLAGEDLTITVTARKNWFIVGRLVPGMSNYLDLAVATTMKCE
jgi:Flp pilus assembly protein TadG